MKTLRCKMKDGTEFIIAFDNQWEIVMFLIACEEKKDGSVLDSFIGVEYDN